MKVAVIGAGAWGTTLASIVARRGETWLWAREREVVDSIAEHRMNNTFLGGFSLPPELRATGSLDHAVHDADVVVVAVPAQHVRSTLKAACHSIPRRATIISAAKGIELTTGRRMSQVLAEVLSEHDPATIGVISGPNLAREVMAGHPGATCVAFSDPRHAAAMQAILMTDTLRVYTGDDVVGCEIGGAAKNVIAIAAGIADGLGYGMNTKAALVTRGLAELARLGVAVGGQPLTFLGLAGNGDLVATCSSPFSRNRHVGEELARGRTVAEIRADCHTFAEGVDTTPALLALADEAGVDMPISATVHAVLRDELAAGDVVARLMRRDPKAELDGLRAHLSVPGTDSLQARTFGPGR